MENENLLPTVGAVVAFCAVVAFSLLVLAPFYSAVDAFDGLKARMGWRRA